MDYFGIYFLLLVFLILMLYFSYLYQRKRYNALRLLAQELGLSFERVGRFDIDKTFGKFHFFSQRQGREIRNRMWGRRNGLDVMVFEYSDAKYAMSSERENYIVFSCKSNEMHLPAFKLLPENIFHKIRQVFGYEDIDFSTHPEFSKSYFLQGRDKAYIYRVFTPNILSFFQQHKNLCLESQGNILLFYKEQLGQTEPLGQKNVTI